MDCSSSVHTILQMRILEWVAIPFSGWSSQHRDWTCSPDWQADSLPLSHQESPFLLYVNFLNNFKIIAIDTVYIVSDKTLSNFLIAKCWLVILLHINPKKNSYCQNLLKKVSPDPSILEELLTLHSAFYPFGACTFFPLPSLSSSTLVSSSLISFFSVLLTLS